MSVGGGYTGRRKRACIFVDGENFRFSLNNLFARKGFSFQSKDYLPNADWHAFFKRVASIQSGWEFLRAYWYVIGTVDYAPHNGKVPHKWKPKRFVIENCVPEALERLAACGDDHKKIKTELLNLTKPAEAELKRRRTNMDNRQRGWRKIQDSIEHNHGQIEFRRSGSNRYYLAEKRFGSEKGVDAHLATDLITLADIYDVAIIVSGDADYIPPVSAIKNMGKLVFSISFLTERGDKLPGGARRLDRMVDGRFEFGFDDLMRLMNITKIEASK